MIKEQFLISNLEPDFTMTKKLPILIIEDELITASAIEELLTEEEYDLIGIAKDAVTALKLCSESATPVSLILCDINIKGTMQGPELAAVLKEKYKCEIIFLTAHSDTKTLTEAFKNDPVMYVVKPYTDKQLLVALQMAFHKIYTSHKTDDRQLLQLTEREKEITQMVAEGMSSKQVASKLVISIETVKTHRRHILQKNNLNNFSQLIYLMNKSS